MYQSIQRRRFLSRAAAAAVGGMAGPSMLSLSQVHAQSEWPQKPVTFFVPATAGGPTDIFARMLARHMQELTGKPFIVDNRPGAGGQIGMSALLNAPADGHTFSFTYNNPVNEARALYKKLPYNPETDFAFIGAITTGGLHLAVNKDLPVKNTAELIALAKTKPINLGSFSLASYTQMFAEHCNKAYGTKFEVLHYKGEGPVWPDVAAGHMHAGIGSFGTYRPFLEKGDIRVIAVAGPSRNPAIPDVSTFKEQGYTADIFVNDPGWIGLVGQARTPPAIVQRLSVPFAEFFGKGEGRPQLLSRGFAGGVVLDAAGFTAWQKDVAPMWVAQARKLGVTLD